MTLKMAYTIHGDRVPYNSESANVRINVKGRTFHAEHQGLPFIEYFYYGGPRVVYYLPEPLEKQIKSDISDFERSPVWNTIFFTFS
ncbi:MAG: hypothetical protein HYS62_02475 [Candidatus Aenigmarchaeota archaeon]|nr:hypothetical protein [Candidatus Aenigmarchaeota archaeon]